MHISWRRDLEAFLSDFVDAHKGLRFGRMFGVPAAYAGRKVFSCAFENGLTAKLPAAAIDHAIEHGGERWAPRGRQMREWVIFRPASSRATEKISPFLELAARHVAQIDSPSSSPRPRRRSGPARRPAMVATRRAVRAGRKGS